jgi:glycosyltransferase involved in cell wall biosynthesis
MAGNSYLADYARQYNENVTIVPTTIDTDKYLFESPPEKDGHLTIGWSGSFSTVQHLDTVREALQELAKRKAFRLRVIGTPNYELPGVDVESLPWRSETEISDLKPIDIGIMPLPDDRWSKGKCGLKALQYMALGIPTVCSPVGVNSVIIQDGENGYIADGVDDWVAKLESLLQDGELRKRLGRAGREVVEREYSARSQAPRVLEIFRSVVGSKAAA